MTSALQRWFLGLGLLAAAVGAVRAADTPPLQAAPAFVGTTFDGQRFELSDRAGRVVMVVLWRTDCAVCLSKMRELRANALGWKAAPFDLVLINLDAGSADAEAYDRARRQVAGHEGPVHSFWHGHTRLPAAWATARPLPLTLIVDTQGRMAARHQGRIPLQAWDQVADLLP